MQNVVLRLFLFLFLASACPRAKAQLATGRTEAIPQFYSLLESIRTQKSDSQIAELQSFINAHPGCERAYLWLLELYLTEERVDDAKDFFYGLRKQAQFSHISEWMIAKIYALEGNLSLATAAFQRAVAHGHPSPEFLIDLLSFEKRLKKSDPNSSLIETGQLDIETERMRHALASYINLDFRSAWRLFTQLSVSLREELAVLYAAGYCNRRLQNSERADSLWQVGVRRSSEINDLEYLTKFLSGIGNILIDKNDTIEALRYFDKADSNANRINDLQRMEYLAARRALLLRDKGEFIRAEVLQQRAIDLAHRLKSDWNLAKWYSHYGVLLYNTDRFSQALRYFDLSAEYASSVNHEQVSLEVLLNKADLYRSIGQEQLAMNLYSDCLDKAQYKGLTEFAVRCMEGKADIYVELGDSSKALAIYEDLISLVKDDKDEWNFSAARWHTKVGRIHLINRNFEKSKESFQRAIEYSKDANYGYVSIWSLIGLAEVEFSTQNLSASRQFYEQCLQISQAKQDSSTLPTIYRGLGDVAKQKGAWQPAIGYYQQAARIIEVTRQGQHNRYIRQQYFANTSRVYDGLIECYVYFLEQRNRSAYSDSLLYVIEKTRARSLQELQRQRQFQRSAKDSVQADHFAQVRNELTQKQRMLRVGGERLFSQTAIDSLMSEIEVSRSSLIAQSLRIKDKTLVETTTTSVSRLQQQAAERKIGWLIYHFSEAASFVLVITADETKLVPLDIKPHDLEQQITELVSPFHALRPENLHATAFKASIAHRLYEQVFSPVTTVESLPPNLVIVPDIELMNLPFEMLLVRPPAQETYTPKDQPVYAKDFLQHDYAITYCPGTQLLRDSHSWRLVSPRVLVYGNPLNSLENPEPRDVTVLATKQPLAADMNNLSYRALNALRLLAGRSLDPLPFSEVEAQNIGNIGSSVVVRSQTEATESLFVQEAPAYDIIHIAGHGFADSTYDSFSGLVLAASNDSTDDGLLMGYEISDLNLKCELITLSACESGRGKPLRGEGILGLPRLFLSVGAKSVLMTMWQVEDSFSSHLMPQIYRAHLRNGEPFSMALASARREMLNKIDKRARLHYQHPVFWAAYQLYGDPGQRTTNIGPVLQAIAALALVIAIVILWQKHAPPRMRLRFLGKK